MKLRKTRKPISLLITLSMLLVLLVPMATPAGAAATYTSITAPFVNDDGNRTLGKFKITIDVNDFANGNKMYVKLPKDFTLYPDTVVDAGAAGIYDDEVIVDDVDGAGVNTIELAAAPNTHYVTVTAPATSNALYPAGGVGANNIALDIISANEFAITYVGGNLTPGENTGVLQVDFNSIYVPSCDGDITATITAPSNSGFSSGSVPIGRTNAGQVNVTVTESETSDNQFDVTLRFEENVTGALEAVAETLTLTLPDGFEWDNLQGVSPIWGDAAVAASIAAADFAGFNSDEIDLNGGGGAITASTVDPACFELTFRFHVEDETEAETGDITVKVTGDSEFTPSEIVVGTYGELGASISIDSVEEVVAGVQEQEIADILVTESIEDSLVAGRTVTIELPAEARWQREVAGNAAPANATANKGVNLNGADYIGTDDRTAKYTVFGGPSSDAAEIKIEDLEILVQPGYTGDIVAKIGGSAGITGEITIATAVAPVTIAADSKPIISIGKAGQAVGDLVVTEKTAGALIDGGQLWLRAPVDVEWDGVPTVEVTSGDLKIEPNSVTRANSNRDLVMTIDRDSKTASTIKVSGAKYKLYRTVPEGDVKVSVLGTAVIDTTPVAGAYAAEWPNNTTVASAVNAVVGTPAPGDTQATTVFKIGESTYTVNGVETTMDVAPYIKSDRTYLPVRYVAYAAGVTDANIIWNEADQSVVLIKGDRVIKLEIGSTSLLINGVAFSMDVAPEIVDPGRTMLPVRWVAQALGCDVQWDEATQSVTVK